MKSKMTPLKLHSLLSLLLFFCWSPTIDALCGSLRPIDNVTTMQCSDLEDVKYIEVYHLDELQTPSTSETLEPGNFKNLTSLQHLDLSGGKIKTIKSGSFSELTLLQTLNLEDNHLNNLESGAFDGLKHLHRLKLRNNAIGQLPSALMTLKELKELDLSGNPLNCNCASLNMRDKLVSKGVKITKETLCSEPSSSKHAPIMKPDTEKTCAFESQDTEMQADEPEGEKVEESTDSGVASSDTKEDVKEDATPTDSPVVPKEEDTPTVAPEVKSEPVETIPSSTESIPTETASSEAPSSSTTKNSVNASPNADEDVKQETTQLSVDSIPKSSEPEKPENVEESKKPEQTDDVTNPDTVTKLDSTSEIPVKQSPDIFHSPAVLKEASGEVDNIEGSGTGSEGSGLFSNPPPIDFETISQVEPETTVTSVETTTKEAPPLWGFGAVLRNILPFGGSETTTLAPSSTEKSIADTLAEEGLIPGLKTDSTPSKTESPPADSPTLKSEVKEDSDGEKDNNSADSAFSLQSKQSTASYIVLAILLAILGILIITAAFKGNFCRRKKNTRDVEKGRELKDMQKSLLDQNASQPKIKPSNGNMMENVPLMHGSVPPEEPKGNQRSYDITASVVTNGNGRSNGKPSRNLPGQEIAPPLNGLNPPMDAIDGPTTMDEDSNEILHNGDYDGRSSPNAQRVKITMQNIPDSLPRTPILITRLQDCENLVKTP
ncbi:hypothetical protein QAD02_001179 [Eretmocerus hayati]|uniref:Uncharacterized protein n=1 Tax=Eretmocerus hayati TaxID=131215 RepID=A0ACC2NFI7_9HYME|nr:hypothetical protein QAD02_001179 [Eretmocerus hayati]